MDDISDNAEGSFKETAGTEADAADIGSALSNTCPIESNEKQDGAVDEVDNSSGSGEVSESESNSESVKCEEAADITKSLVRDKKDVTYNQIENEDCDDRSQTPLQDEIESVQNLDNECSNENSVSTDNMINEAHLKSPGAKDGAVNDDHGELDYEEDEMMEDGQDKAKVDLDSKASDKEKKPDSEQKTDAKESEIASSDGELADDDDCEEGEIKEPGTKKPFVRPLCRFFTRGNCTWGINCRFLHPGINDKGNYSLIEQQHSFVPSMPPPGMMPMLRGPPPSWVHERFGKRMLPPPRPSELHQPDPEGTGVPAVGTEGPASESAWERGLRHAKEIQRKRRDTDGDDKKEKEDSHSPAVSPSRGSALSSQLAPPPPRDPYYDDLHRPLPPSIPGRLPLPMPLPPPLHHPEAWPYRHPFEYEMRWHRPPPPEFMHLGFPPIPDMRFMDRERMGGSGRRFSPPLRMDANHRKDDRMSRYDRYRTSDVQGGGAAESSRGKCEEWKDPWLRTKSPKKKHPSSSRSGSRDRKRSRSKRSYSSFSSSSYSSKSRSRSRSSSASSSSSRSSFSSRSSYSRSRSSSKSSKSIPKKVAAVGGASKKQSPLEKPLKLSDPAPKSVITKVIPPSLADMSTVPSTKASSIPSSSQQSITGTASVGQASTSTGTSRNDPPKPMMTSLSITLGNKPSSSVSRTNQLQPVGKSVAEAFKDADDDVEDDVKMKSKMSKLPIIEPSKIVEMTTPGGLTYKSGIVEGNIGYPIPVKPSMSAEAPKKGLLPSQDTVQKGTSRSSSSSSNGSSSSSHSHNSHSSSSNSGDSDHIYSDIASPISSDGSISPRTTGGQKMYSDRGNVVPPTRTTESHPSRGTHMFAGDRGRRDVRGGGRPPDYRMDRRECRDPYGFPGEPGRMGRKEYRPDQRQDYVGRADPKFMGRKVGHDVMTHPDPRADNRDHYRSDMRKVDQRTDMKSSRQDHSRSGERVSARMGMHPQLNRREDRGSQGRVPQEPQGEYRRVVHAGPPTRVADERHTPSHKAVVKPTKVDTRNAISSKRPVSPHMQRSSPKRMRIAPEYKEPVKIPIPKQKFAVARGSMKTSKESFEEEMRPQSHSSNKPPVPAKVPSKKSSTSSKREELLLQLKAVEDAIAKKRSKNQ